MPPTSTPELRERIAIRPPLAEALRSTSRPSDVRDIWPAFEAMPACMLTPEPLSVDSRLIRPAYMPPRSELSMATAGSAPSDPSGVATPSA